MRITPQEFWCGRRDSNPQGLLHWHLKPARLPVPPRPRSWPRHTNGRENPLEVHRPLASGAYICRRSTGPENADLL